jgi:hypothetical protein
MDDYSTPVTYTGDSMGALGPIFVAFMGVFYVIMMVVAVVLLISYWKIFTKAGKPGWAALIPIYNAYTMLQVIGRPGWWLLLFFLGVIPFVGSIALLVIGVILALDLAKSFGKSSTFAILGFMFFPIIGFPMLAFGSAKYVGPAALQTTPIAPVTPVKPKV